MLNLLNDISLTTMNTLQVNVRANRFCRIRTESELGMLIADGRLQSGRWFVLGGGSNILFTQDYDGLILKMDIKGVRVALEDCDTVLLDVKAGENWPDLVAAVVAKGWGGIENLALIPGTAGAAPIQNIAAYGHNLSDTLVSVDAVDSQSGKNRRFTAEECKPGYRTSVFKEDLKNRYIITGIRLQLTKKPRLNTTYQSRYESVDQELAVIANPPYRVSDVFQAIVNIRRRKLPDIEVVGSAGSIFKNPVVTRETLLRIRKTCLGIHFYPLEQLSYGHIDTQKGTIPERVKIPAAWLIEETGWAGKRVGSCGIWPTQPLNIVNYGGATAMDFLDLVNSVRSRVLKKYGVQLELEIELVS